MRKIFLLFLLPIQVLAQNFSPAEITRWQQQAQQINIIRDNWGVPHIYGKTDADAVFGLLYAQCEDDFKRVEMNYIEKLGRTAEIKGETELYNDLLIRLIIDSADAVKDYKASPLWLQKILNAYADGLNYYLYKNPQTHPLLLHHFKPWYPLLWTDGSIGAIDIGDITGTEIKNFYTGTDAPVSIHKNAADELTTGSNGFALAPSKTESGNAILYINPHVSFYFRPEVHVISEEGLNVYGAVTWGQLFVYQGFNEHCGWMHTSGYTDVADLYAEKIIKKGNELFYEYNKTLKPVRKKIISLQYHTDAGIQTKKITTYYTHHGPVMAKRNGQWVAVKSNNRSMKGFTQSWMRTKSNGFAAYKKNMELLSNTSNNTVFADDKGNIAYWHGNFVPRRNTKYNWAKPVDGSTSATEWKGLHSLSEIVHAYNPITGWIQNCNSTPFTVSGRSSPKKENYPKYMAPDGENFRGINAAALLSSGDHYTIDKVIATGYDTHLAAFDVLLPALLNAFEKSKTDTTYKTLEEPVKILTDWDKHSSETSVATTLAIEWGQKVLPVYMKNQDEEDETDQVDKAKRFAANASPAVLLEPLLLVVKELTAKFGKWQMAWGEVNRYQRLSGSLAENFDDNQPSLPVGFTASTWGCVPSFVSRSYAGSSKRYGFNGSSFICAVEFGKRLKAKALLTGGESGDINSKHFNDQALMYTKGQFRDVLFYKEDILSHAEKKYHPGE
jgi:acyl-homoserine-lactone acylase